MGYIISRKKCSRGMYAATCQETISNGGNSMRTKSQLVLSLWTR